MCGNGFPQLLMYMYVHCIYLWIKLLLCKQLLNNIQHTVFIHVHVRVQHKECVCVCVCSLFVFLLTFIVFEKNWLWLSPTDT